MERTTGTYVSAAGHLALLVWLIGGWGFDSEPLPFEISEVSVVSSEEYAAIVAATTPDPTEAPPDAPEAPSAEAAPEVPVQEEAAATPPPPDAVQPPTPDLPPPPAPEPPEPMPVISDSPATPGPPAEEVVAAPNLTASPRPIPRPAQRITPDAVAPPPPDAAPADVAQDMASPDAAPDAPVVEQAQEQTAPEEAATEIVTEAETPQGLVTETPRPRTRPNRPTPAPAPEVEPETQTAEAPAPQVDQSAVQAALEAAAAATAPPSQAANVPQGPPMTGSEREGFRVSVQNCWNVGAMSTAVQRINVVVSFTLGEDRKVIGDVKLESSSGGESQGDIDSAYQFARRAILQCQNRSDGFPLPQDKYSEWKDIELTFDPSSMRLR
jgi:hypothetical protein